MNGKLAIITGSLVMALVACSGSDDTRSAVSSPSDSSSSDDAPVELPAATPEETPPKDLIEDCQGRWLCTPCGEYQDELYMAREGKRCILAGGIELGPGGDAHGVYESKFGSWRGDSRSFHLEIRHACTLSPGIVEDAIDCRRKDW